MAYLSGQPRPRALLRRVGSELERLPHPAQRREEERRLGASTSFLRLVTLVNVLEGHSAARPTRRARAFVYRNNDRRTAGADGATRRRRRWRVRGGRNVRAAPTAYHRGTAVYLVTARLDFNRVHSFPEFNRRARRREVPANAAASLN